MRGVSVPEPALRLHQELHTQLPLAVEGLAARCLLALTEQRVAIPYLVASLPQEAVAAVEDLKTALPAVLVGALELTINWGVRETRQVSAQAKATTVEMRLPHHFLMALPQAAAVLRRRAALQQLLRQEMAEMGQHLVFPAHLLPMLAEAEAVVTIERLRPVLELAVRVVVVMVAHLELVTTARLTQVAVVAAVVLVAPVMLAVQAALALLS